MPAQIRRRVATVLAGAALYTLAMCSTAGSIEIRGWAFHGSLHSARPDRGLRTVFRATVLRLRGGRGFFGVDPTTRYYEILGLRKLDLPDENAIKKAYHKKALKCHPDRAPPEQKDAAEKEFKLLKEAYDVLMDPQKRHVYDTEGEGAVRTWEERAQQQENAEFGGQHGSMPWSRSPHDIPSAWEQYFGVPFAFGDVPAGARHPFTVRRSIRRNLYLTLEELYHGGTKSQTVSVFRIDERSGFAVPADKTFNIPVKPGWKEGTKVTFEDPVGLQDVVFVVREKRHEHFRRRGNDLQYTCELSRKDVRDGINVTIPTLSANEVHLHIQPNSRMVTTHKSKVIVNEGMPVRQSDKSGTPQTGSFCRGNLVIKFVVRGWVHRRLVAPGLALSTAALKVGSVAAACFLVLRHPLRTMSVLWTISSRLTLLAGLLVMYT